MNAECTRPSESTIHRDLVIYIFSTQLNNDASEHL